MRRDEVDSRGSGSGGVGDGSREKIADGGEQGGMAGGGWLGVRARRLVSDLRVAGGARAAAERLAAEAEAGEIARAERAFREATREQSGSFAAWRGSFEAGVLSERDAINASFAERSSSDRAKLKRELNRLVSETTEVEEKNSLALKEALWVAETVYEAGQSVPRNDFVAATKRLGSGRSRLTSIEGDAGVLFRRFRFRGQGGAGAVAGAPADGGKGAGVAKVRPLPVADGAVASGGEVSGAGGSNAEALLLAFESAIDGVEGEVVQLSHLVSPRLAEFPNPLVLVVVSAIGGAVLGAWRVGWSVGPGSGAAVDLGVWAGVGFAVGLVVAAVLMVASRAVVRGAGASIVEQLAAAHDLEVEAQASAERRRDEAMDRLVRRRDAERDAARAKHGPVISEMKSKRESGRAALEERLSRLTESLRTERLERLRELDSSYRSELSRREAELAAATGDARAELDAAVSAANAKRAEADGAARTAWLREAARLSDVYGSVVGETGALLGAWDDGSWESWQPPTSAGPGAPFGRVKVDLSLIEGAWPDDASIRAAMPRVIDVPAMLGACGGGAVSGGSGGGSIGFGSLVVRHGGDGRRAAVDLLGAVMSRLLTTIPPGKARFTIVDPVGLGQSFAGFMHLADHAEQLVGTRIWTESRHIEQRLADLTEHMENVIQKYLRNEFATIDAYNERAGEIAEPYRFLVIADFPVNMTEESARRLGSIVSAGARCGVYVLCAHDVRQRMPGTLRVEDLDRSATVVAERALLRRVGSQATAPDGGNDRGAFVVLDEVFGDLPLALERGPGEGLLTTLLHRIGEGARDATRVQVPFTTIAPGEGKLWSLSAAGVIEVPIGRAGATKLQKFSLGRGTSQHALIAGKTGSGKSTLLHVLVTNVAMWYGPDEAEFYLVDFKKGVEFKTYATHRVPHARAIAIESDREFGLSVLQRLDEELKLRGDLFRELGAQDLASARLASKAAGRDDHLPRTLLIVDEFQEFFTEDDQLSGEAQLLLDRLVRQGRAFGIHVVLGSQTLAGAYSLARATMGQMGVRVALQCAEADSLLILSDDNTAARLLGRPGEAIYNDQGGLLEGNNPFQIAWLADSARDAMLERVRARTAGTGGSLAKRRTVVFEGNAPAKPETNGELMDLLRSRGVASGDRGQRMTSVFVGEPVAIADPVRVDLVRRSGSNVLIVGQNEDAALAMGAMALVSAAAQWERDGGDLADAGDGGHGGVSPDVDAADLAGQARDSAAGAASSAGMDRGDDLLDLLSLDDDDIDDGGESAAVVAAVSNGVGGCDADGADVLDAAGSLARFVVLDGLSPADPRFGVLGKLVRSLPQRCEVVEGRGVEDALRRLVREVDRRIGLGGVADAEPSIMLVVHGLHKFRELRRSDDFGMSFGGGGGGGGDGAGSMSAGAAFERIVMEGPSVGVHTVAWCDSAAGVERSLSRQALREFTNRVLFQMSLNDSSALMDSPEAAKLGSGRALLSSEAEGGVKKFRPYAMPDGLVGLFGAGVGSESEHGA